MIWRVFRPLYLPLLEKLQRRKIVSELKTGNKKNKSRKFIVIWNQSIGMGIMSYVKNYLYYIEWATKKDLIPVIDMKNFPNSFLSEENENGWELFFEQPGGYSLEEVYESRKVKLGTGWLPQKTSMFNDYFDIKSEEERLYWCNLFSKYIRLNSVMKELLQQYRAKVMGNGEKVLGVYVRGTDYTKSKPHGHYIQPDARVVLQKAEEVMAEYKCTRLFLSTEDADIFKMFKEYFKDTLYYIERYRFSVKENEFLPQLARDKHMDYVKINRDYLCEMYLLAECDCMIGGQTGGTEILKFMHTENYEYEYIWKLGKYD